MQIAVANFVKKGRMSPLFRGSLEQGSLGLMVSIFEQNGTGPARFRRPLSLWCQPCPAFVPSLELSPPNTIQTPPENTTFAVQDLTSNPANWLNALRPKPSANNKAVAMNLAVANAIVHLQTDTYKNLIPTLSILRNTRHESC
ncbi:hypothetical protein ACRN9F_21290 [Shewanella oncorhynchi]|uniref:hypothetical protein n=1 Tax=Shewanella oncorhynchi TaxID=2726434 RepID=UPI003D7AD34C